MRILGALEPVAEESRFKNISYNHLKGKPQISIPLLSHYDWYLQ